MVCPLRVKEMWEEKKEGMVKEADQRECRILRDVVLKKMSDPQVLTIVATFEKVSDTKTSERQLIDEY